MTDWLSIHQECCNFFILITVFITFLNTGNRFASCEVQFNFQVEILMHFLNYGAVVLVPSLLRCVQVDGHSYLCWILMILMMSPVCDSADSWMFEGLLY